MTADAARSYLVANVASTATGRAILRSLGYGAIIAAPGKGDDTSTIRIAEAVLAEFARRYVR